MTEEVAYKIAYFGFTEAKPHTSPSRTVKPDQAVAGDKIAYFGLTEARPHTITIDVKKSTSSRRLPVAH